MLKHSELILKIACVGLGMLFLFQMVRVVVRIRPLENLNIPELPHLALAVNIPIAGKGTNSATSQLSVKKATNSAAMLNGGKAETNAVPGGIATRADTNLVAGTQAVISATNTSPEQATGRKETNSIPTQTAGKPDPKAAPRPSPAISKGPDFPPMIQARVDRVIQSEILGPVNRPLPMGLVGIAGNVAFLRAASGQTGLVKVGDELGGLKLLQIGINRVLVEHEGQKKELTMFSGFGSESLVPKPKETNHETTAKSK